LKPGVAFKIIAPHFKYLSIGHYGSVFFIFLPLKNGKKMGVFTMG
jgi:hypothetical protein